MANDERDASHIWLRQSVRSTEDGRERTIEIAVPLPIGATPQETERLLAEADAVLARLGEHLGQQAEAALRGGATVAPAPPAAAAPTLARPTVAPTRAAGPAAVPAHTGAAPNRIAEPPPPSLSRGGVGGEVPATSASAPAPLSPQGGGVGGGAPLSRPEFLTETRALGLTPPQAMERLGVRSLDGLNLHEALDMLRRQLRNGASATAPEPTAPEPTAPEPAAPEPAAPRANPIANGAAPANADLPPPATIFDEEEEFELVVLGPDVPSDDDGADLPYGDAGEASEPVGALDALDDDDDALDDVPDLGALLPPPPPAPARPAGGSAFTPAQKARARELVAGFRGIAPGGSAISSQQRAFANVVVDQLDAATAETLVRGLWGQPPDRLGFDHLAAVIHWGKRDEFAEEAPVVLALLRAEQAHKARTSGASAAGATPAAPGDENAPPAPRPARATRKPASGEGRS
jgi:hypothetical protein